MACRSRPTLFGLLSVLSQVCSAQALVDVFVHGESEYYCIKIPTLVYTANRSLLALGEARSKGGTSCSDFTGTDLVIKRSMDGGQTWSPLRVVHSEPNTTVIGNVAPVQLKSGRILFPFCKNNKEVLLTWSDDDGLTFSDPIPLPSATEKTWKWVGLGPPSGLLLPDAGGANGRVLIPSYHTTLIHGDGEISKGHALISDDDGKTWKLGGSFGGATHLPNECQAVDLGNGTVLISSRGQVAHRLQTLSTDAGLTFGETEEVKDLEEPLQGCEGSMIRHPGTGDLWFSGPQAGAKGPVAPLYRENMQLFRSTDQGKSWTYHSTIDAGASGYSALAVLGNGSIAVLYERRNGTQVVFVPEQISFKIAVE